jgi:hypothetical protein
MVIHSCNPSTEKAKTADLKFKASLGYIKTLPQKTALIQVESSMFMFETH